MALPAPQILMKSVDAGNLVESNIESLQAEIQNPTHYNVALDKSNNIVVDCNIW